MGKMLLRAYWICGQALSPVEEAWRIPARGMAQDVARRSITVASPHNGTRGSCTGRCRVAKPVRTLQKNLGPAQSASGPGCFPGCFPGGLPAGPAHLVLRNRTVACREEVSTLGGEPAEGRLLHLATAAPAMSTQPTPLSPKSP